MVSELNLTVLEGAADKGPRQAIARKKGCHTVRLPLPQIEMAGFSTSCRLDPRFCSTCQVAAVRSPTLAYPCTRAFPVWKDIVNKAKGDPKDQLDMAALLANSGALTRSLVATPLKCGARSQVMHHLLCPSFE